MMVLILCVCHTHNYTGSKVTDCCVASRFIIDTLNESVFDLPDEGREMLNRYLCPTTCPTKQEWKFWKKE